MPKNSNRSAPAEKAPQRRTARIPVLLYPAEKEQIEREAKRLGRKTTTHARLVLLRRQADLSAVHDPHAQARKLAQNLLGLLEIGDYVRAADECERVLRTGPNAE